MQAPPSTAPCCWVVRRWLTPSALASRAAPSACTKRKPTTATVPRSPSAGYPACRRSASSSVTATFRTMVAWCWIPPSAPSRASFSFSCYWYQWLESLSHVHADWVEVGYVVDCVVDDVRHGYLPLLCWMIKEDTVLYHHTYTLKRVHPQLNQRTSRC